MGGPTGEVKIVLHWSIKLLCGKLAVSQLGTANLWLLLLPQIKRVGKKKMLNLILPRCLLSFFLTVAVWQSKNRDNMMWGRIQDGKVKAITITSFLCFNIMYSLQPVIIKVTDRLNSLKEGQLCASKSWLIHCLWGECYYMEVLKATGVGLLCLRKYSHSFTMATHCSHNKLTPAQS